MSSDANKKQFLKQMEGIVEGIKQNKTKVTGIISASQGFKFFFFHIKAWHFSLASNL